jgi:hypothetical protein
MSKFSGVLQDWGNFKTTSFLARCKKYWINFKTTNPTKLPVSKKNSAK